MCCRSDAATSMAQSGWECDLTRQAYVNEHIASVPISGKASTSLIGPPHLSYSPSGFGDVSPRSK